VVDIATPVCTDTRAAQRVLDPPALVAHRGDARAREIPLRDGAATVPLASSAQIHNMGTSGGASLAA
jgi:hypothetical protein